MQVLEKKKYKIMEQQNQNTYTQFFPDGEENGHKGKDYQSGMKGADNPFLLLNGFGMVTGTEISVFVREIKTSVPVLYSLRETSTGGHSEGRARFVRGIRTLQNYFYMFFAKEKKSLIKSGHIVLKRRLRFRNRKNFFSVPETACKRRGHGRKQAAF